MLFIVGIYVVGLGIDVGMYMFFNEVMFNVVCHVIIIPFRFRFFFFKYMNLSSGNYDVSEPMPFPVFDMA